MNYENYESVHRLDLDRNLRYIVPRRISNTRQRTSVCDDCRGAPRQFVGRL